MTPNDIEVLIHCYCCVDKHPRIDAPAVMEAIQKFLDDEIIMVSGGDKRYRTTEKGKALIEALCKTPYPRQVWIDQNGEVL